jgi:TRAP-type C4-dicarboxylate transport system substrate-binding protein
MPQRSVVDGFFSIRRCGRCLGLALAGIWIGSAQAQGKLVLRVSDQFPPGHFVSDSARFWMAEVEKQLGGNIKFEYYPNEQLGKARDQPSLLQSGVVDISVIVPSYVSDKMPYSAAAELPGMISPKSSCIGALAYSRQSREGFFAKNDYEPNGVRMLWAFAYPPYQINLLKKRLAAIKDVEGLKVRVIGSGMDQLLRDLKAVPVRIPLPDLFESASRGTVDGLMFTYAGVYAYKLDSLVKSVTKGGNFGTAVGGYAVGEKRWKELPADVRKALVEAGERATRHLCARMDRDEIEAEKKLIAQGVTFMTPSAAEQQELDRIFGTAVSEWATMMDKRGKLGTDAVRAFKAAVAGQ